VNTIEFIVEVIEGCSGEEREEEERIKLRDSRGS